MKISKEDLLCLTMGLAWDTESQTSPTNGSPTNRADIPVVICDTPQKATMLVENVEKGLTPGLKTIIRMDPFDDDLMKRGEKCGVEMLSLHDAENIGKENFKKPVPPKPEDLSVICFTSGTTVNNEGEICIKGNNVFKGYLKDPEKTQEVLDKDGWLHTGDIGRWLPNGTLKIVDRKKNIFKLAQGEYIAPEKIENVYSRSRPVLQVFVHGESLRSFLIGVVVPDPDSLPSFAAKIGVKGSFEELCKNQCVKEAILEDLQKIGKEGGLKSFEQVKSIFVHPEPFTIENGLLTPTLKAKRVELAKFFQTQIKSLYESIEE